MASIIKRTKNGASRYEAAVRRRGYPPQSKTFKTRAAAKDWATNIESEMARGIFVSNAEAERTTLGEALERYWCEIASQKRYPKKERWFVDRWLRHPYAKYFVHQLRGADWAKYRDERRAQGRAENTIRIELAMISHMYEIARKEWGMEGLLNPTRNMRKPSGSKERDRRLEPGEYENISRELAKSSNPWILPLFEFAIESALRQGMLFQLRWEWVDLSRRVISIPKAFRAMGNKGVPAALPLSLRATSILHNLPRSIDGRIFPTSQNALVCVWKRTLQRLGVVNLRWHDLRHEAASRLFEKGLHPFEVAALTGHKTMNMLRRYTHLRPEDLIEKIG